MQTPKQVSIRKETAAGPDCHSCPERPRWQRTDWPRLSLGWAAFVASSSHKHSKRLHATWRILERLWKSLTCRTLAHATCNGKCKSIRCREHYLSRTPTMSYKLQVLPHPRGFRRSMPRHAMDSLFEQIRERCAGRGCRIGMPFESPAFQNIVGLIFPWPCHMSLLLWLSTGFLGF